MLDDKQEVEALITALNEHLPLRAWATPPLAMSLRQKQADLSVHDPLQIDSVFYLSDEGGVACAIKLQRGSRWSGRTINCPRS